MAKAQVATEFFVYAGIFLIIVIAAAVGIYFTENTELSLLESTVAKDTGEVFANSVNMAIAGGKGFTYEVGYPRDILGTPYAMTFKDTFVYMDWAGPHGNFSYVYNTGHYNFFYRICNPGNQRLVSGLGNNKLILTNNGDAITLTQGGDGCQIKVQQ